MPGAPANVTGKAGHIYRVTDGTTTWALRRPPLAHVLPTAHDMVREFRVISALAGTAVPVASAIALCDDRAVLGAPFYLMDFVDGVVLDRPKALARLDQNTARATCEQLMDTLVALHEVDPAQVGLADFGRPEGFLERQVRRWGRQLEGSRSRDGRLNRGRTGLARIAAETGVPVVPCATVGAYELCPPGAKVPRPRKVAVRFGTPMVFPGSPMESPTSAELRAWTDELMEQIRQLSGQEPSGADAAGSRS